MNQELAGAKHSWIAGPRFSHKNGAVLLYYQKRHFDFEYLQQN